MLERDRLANTEAQRAGAVLQRGGLDIRVERPGFTSLPMRKLGVPTCAVSRPAIVRLLARARMAQIVASADGAAEGRLLDAAPGRPGCRQTAADEAGSLDEARRLRIRA